MILILKAHQFQILFYYNFYFYFNIIKSNKEKIYNMIRFQ